MDIQSLKVVTLGGGSGAPPVLRALLKLGVRQLTAICAASDSGGKTGVIRSDERDRVIAISDLFRNLIALIPPEANHALQVQTFIDTVSFVDGRNRNLGYSLYYALLEKYRGNFTQVQKHFERLLDLKFAGQALPVTLEPSNIAFETESGRKFLGEHELDLQSMSRDQVERIWLEPEARASRRVLKAIEAADVIIYCPGSLYGSVLANVLPSGVREALKGSKAKKIIFTNLVSDRNQTHQFGAVEYLTVFSRYLGVSKPFDLVIMPNLSHSHFNKLYPRVADQYRLEHSYFLGRRPGDIKSLAKRKIELIHADIFSITVKLSRIRHDPDKLAAVLSRVFGAKK
jgi:uncharacterized cofD-like protein